MSDQTTTATQTAVNDDDSDAILKIRNLEVKFKTVNGTVQAVRGVDVTVSGGETLGIVGESGSGKSVTFLASMGLLPGKAQISGSVKVGDVEMVNASRKTLDSVRGNEIAMIFQDPLSALNPVYRIGDQIVEMIQSHQDMSDDDAAKRAVDLLGMVGIPQPKDRARQYPHEFSGGMRQRVMIAMAIANDPKVLIADEPTTALDVTVQSQILDLLERIRDEFNTAVVMITHDLGVVARIASKIQVMYAGRAAERTTVVDMFNNPRHPYTVGLLNSIPRPGTSRLVPIPGSPPNMLHPPQGCAFGPRCPHVADVCRAELPDLHQVPGGETACVRFEEFDLDSEIVQ